MADTAASAGNRTRPGRSTHRHELMGALAAEVVGTFIIVAFGDGSVAQAVGGGSGLGNHNSIAWAWGIGVALGIFAAGRISGAHLNPAVTLSLAVFRKFSWRRVLPYMGAQVVGAFCAALLVWWDYASILDKVDPHHTVKTGIVFATQPGNGTLPVSVLGAFRDQIIGTALLLFIIFVILDDRLFAVPLGNLSPLIIGLIVVVIGFAFGSDAGYAINPARDLGPRAAEYLVGYEHAWMDRYGSYYFWVPIAGPLIGGLVGGGLYELLVGRYLPVEAIDEGPGDFLEGDHR